MSQFCGVLGPYRWLAMTFRILATSNIKNSMTFLIAEPPLRRTDHQRYQGPPPQKRNRLTFAPPARASS